MEGLPDSAASASLIINLPSARSPVIRVRKKTTKPSACQKTVKFPQHYSATSAVTPVHSSNVHHKALLASSSVYTPTWEEAALPDTYFSQAEINFEKKESDDETYFSDADNSIIESSQPYIKLGENELLTNLNYDNLEGNSAPAVESRDVLFEINSQFPDVSQNLGGEIDSLPETQENFHLFEINSQIPETCDTGSQNPGEKIHFQGETEKNLEQTSQSVEETQNSEFKTRQSTRKRSQTKHYSAAPAEHKRNPGRTPSQVNCVMETPPDSYLTPPNSQGIVTRSRICQPSQSTSWATPDATTKDTNKCDPKLETEEVITPVLQPSPPVNVKNRKNHLEKKVAIKSVLQQTPKAKRTRITGIQQQERDKVANLLQCFQVIQRAVQSWVCGKGEVSNVTQAQTDISVIENKARALKLLVQDPLKSELEQILESCELLSMQLHYVPHLCQKKTQASRSTPGIKRRVLSSHSQEGKNACLEMTSLPSLQQLLAAQVLLPGPMNLVLSTADGIEIPGSLNEVGEIHTPDGCKFISAEDWCRSMLGQDGPVTTHAAYNNVSYYGESLFSLAVTSLNKKSETCKKKTARKQKVSVTPDIRLPTQDQIVIFGDTGTALCSVVESLSTEVKNQYSEVETQFSDANHSLFDEHISPLLNPNLMSASHSKQQLQNQALLNLGTESKINDLPKIKQEVESTERDEESNEISVSSSPKLVKRVKFSVQEIMTIESQFSPQKISEQVEIKNEIQELEDTNIVINTEKSPNIVSLTKKEEFNYSLSCDLLPEPKVKSVSNMEVSPVNPLENVDSRFSPLSTVLNEVTGGLDWKQENFNPEITDILSTKLSSETSKANEVTPLSNSVAKNDANINKSKITETDKIRILTVALINLRHKTKMLMEKFENEPDSCREKVKLEKLDSNSNSEITYKIDESTSKYKNEQEDVKVETEGWRNFEKAKVLKIWREQVQDWSANPRSIYRESLKIKDNPVLTSRDSSQTYFTPQQSQTFAQNDQNSQEFSSNMKDEITKAVLRQMEEKWPFGFGNSTVSEVGSSQEIDIIESSQDNVAAIPSQTPKSNKFKQDEHEYPASLPKPRFASLKKSEPCRKVNINNSSQESLTFIPTNTPKLYGTIQDKHELTSPLKPCFASAMKTSQSSQELTVNSQERAKRNLSGAWKASNPRLAQRLRNSQSSQEITDSPQLETELSVSQEFSPSCYFKGNTSNQNTPGTPTTPNLTLINTQVSTKQAVSLEAVSLGDTPSCIQLEHPVQNFKPQNLAENSLWQNLYPNKVGAKSNITGNMNCSQLYQNYLLESDASAQPNTPNKKQTHQWNGEWVSNFGAGPKTS